MKGTILAVTVAVLVGCGGSEDEAVAADPLAVAIECRNGVTGHVAVTGVPCCEAGASRYLDVNGIPAEACYAHVWDCETAYTHRLVGTEWVPEETVEVCLP